MSLRAWSPVPVSGAQCTEVSVSALGWDGNISALSSVIHEGICRDRSLRWLVFTH